MQKTSQSDAMDPARAAAMLATLGEQGTIGSGDHLPPFFHQLYFWTPRPPSELGPDGHPAVGDDLIPDMGLPRRMWAGGRLRFHAPLLAGVPAERVSVCEAATAKTGRSGALGLVTLKHEISQDGRLCVTEWQDLIYREAASPGAPRPEPPVAPGDEDSCRHRDFSSTVLFRYSALTFNGHRIHYDETYSRGVEGYDGLVVHGPLLAQCLMLMAQDELGPLKRFEFRATSPLMHTETAEFCRSGRAFWVRGPDGRQCMTAQV